MSNFKDMPLDTTLQKGDVVTITGPGEHDVLVREVTRLDAWDGSAVVAGMVGPTANMVVILGREGRTLTRVQRPIALPTVDGYYILTYGDGSRALRTLVHGIWRVGSGGRASTDDLLDHIESDATLTRVIPAVEVKHPAVSVTKASAALVDAWGNSENTRLTDDFEAVLERVLKGEFDL